MSEPIKSLVAAAGADPEFTAAIVDTLMPDKGNGELRFYRKLLSGVLDPDKLDYLNRDAQYCGVPYGAQDVDFILSRLHPHPERGVDIDSRGIPSVESILFSKYLMYRTVYWHRSVRSATAMIKKALLGSLEQGLISGEELYDLDDQSLFALMESRSGACGGLTGSKTAGKTGSKTGAGKLLALARKVRDGRLYLEAAALPFDEGRHQPLLKIENRSQYEKALADTLSGSLGKSIPADDLIIDVPEPISFETGLFVVDEEKFFSESSSAFKAEMVDALVKSLHIIRIFIDPIHELDVQSLQTLQGILHKTQNWLHL
jgi:hypothetical protein